MNNIEETIKINPSSITIKVLTYQGQNDEFLVILSPSLQVSGYGKTEFEDKESFDHNMRVFCEDLMQLETKKRDKYLNSLGFNLTKKANENFSKILVDSSGSLIGLNISSVNKFILENTY